MWSGMAEKNEKHDDNFRINTVSGEEKARGPLMDKYINERHIAHFFVPPIER
jgi:hypothetical protein